MNITVVGLGYVGLSNAVLLAQHNNVRALEIDQAKVDKINQGISPIAVGTLYAGLLSVIEFIIIFICTN